MNKKNVYLLCNIKNITSVTIYSSSISQNHNWLVFFYFWREMNRWPGCALKRDCCTILEKGDFVLVHRWRAGVLWHFVRSFVASLFRLTLFLWRGCRSVQWFELDSLLDRRGWRRCEQSVGRAARCATFVRETAPLASLQSWCGSIAGVKEIAICGKEIERWQCRNLAHLTVLMPRSKKLRRCAIWRRTNVSARSKS